MKKKILSIILALLLVFPLMTSCMAEKKPTQDKSVIELANFEQWAPDFQLLRPMSNFGYINKNTDKAYVKSGESSALLKPMGGYSKLSEPFFYIPLKSELFEFDYSDFSKVAEIQASVYNAEPAEQKMRVGLINQIINTETVGRVNETEFSLVNGWNEVSYLVDLNVLNISNNITDVQGVYFSFNNAGVREIKDAPTLYMDDIKIIKDLEIGEIQDLVTLDDNEICGFEKLYQNYIISTMAVKNPKCMPEFGVVNASDYGITATEGEKVLRLLTKPGDTNDGSWPRIVIPEKIMKKSNFSSFTKEEISKVTFKFDVYNNNELDRYLYPDFYSENGGNLTQSNVKAVKGKWSTFSYPLSNLNDAILKAPGYFTVAWAEYTPDLGNLEFFLDNFRIEIKE